MRVLYISQNGMAENLGQAQVLPYLRGLARRGAEIDLVSFELATLAPARRRELEEDLAAAGLRWHALTRTMGTPLSTKVAEAARGVLTALATGGRRRPNIVHGRSYFASAIGDAVATVTRSKLLFDCRGMIGDEFVDCGHWTTDRLEYRLVKAYERRLFRSADGIVFLTRALETWLRDRSLLGKRPAVSVIPCCVDRAKFAFAEDARNRIRRELGVEDALVVVYSGSLGTWYLEPEMARFTAALARRVRASDRRLAFVCLTPSDASGLKAALGAAGIGDADVVVRRVAPKEMPAYLSAGDVGLSFIQSCFSKKGSSPTKVAEYLACGNVAVVNGDIGDQADLAAERDAVVVLPDFTDTSIEAAADRTAALASAAVTARLDATVAAARRHFDLEEIGVRRYAALYERLAGQPLPPRS